jgi:hypothetical protein
MEMRSRHWIGITVVACSFLGVASLPPDPIRPRYRLGHRPTPERAAVVRLERQLFIAQYLLRNAERRDVAMAEITAAGSDGAPPFLASDELPDGVREILEEKVRDAVGGLQLEGGPVRAVLTARMSGGNRWDYGSILHLLPRAIDGRTCVTMYDLGPAAIALLDDGATPQAVVDHTLRPGWRSNGTPLARGPCAFFARFGLPGPHVEAWLEQQHFTFAYLADWDRAQREEVLDRELRDPFTGLARWYGLNALGCAAGRPDRCRQALMGEPAKNSYQSGRLNAMQDAGWLYGEAYSNVFGPATNHFLSDVVSDVGPERFEEFWTSDLPVEQAFASVVGKDIGEWTAEWITSRVGESHFGPGVGFSGILVVALFAGLGVFAGAYVAENRKAG